MKHSDLIDWRELQRELRLEDNTNFDDNSFASACRRASEKVISSLRPTYQVKLLKLSEHTTETISGTTTSSGTNVINDSAQSLVVDVLISLGFDVEAIIYDADEFYVADVVSNTADSITVSDETGDDITVPDSATYYLRMKLSNLNEIVLSYAMDNFTINNRQARGTEENADMLERRVARAKTELKEMIDPYGYDVIHITKSQSITLNYDEEKRLSASNIVYGSAEVDYSGTTYYPEQGYKIDYSLGTIKYIEPNDDQETYLEGAETITVEYEYSIRMTGVGAG